MKVFTEDRIRELDGSIQGLARLIEKNADAIELGRAAAPVHLKCINEAMVYINQLHSTFGLQLIMSDGTPEESLPVMNTVLRMYGDLSSIVLSQMTGFLNCFGGTTLIALQVLEQRAVTNRGSNAVIDEATAKLARIIMRRSEEFKKKSES